MFRASLLKPTWRTFLAVIFALVACDCFAATCAHRGARGGCRAGCEVCCPTMEEVTEEKSCWNVECETVCIPAFRFPWQPGGSKLTLFSWLDKGDDCCRYGDCSSDASRVGHQPCHCHCSRPPSGAIRYVRVLAEETFEVTISKCKWEIRRRPWVPGAEAAADGSDGDVSRESPEALPQPPGEP